MQHTFSKTVFQHHGMAQSMIGWCGAGRGAGLTGLPKMAFQFDKLWGELFLSPLQRGMATSIPGGRLLIVFGCWRPCVRSVAARPLFGT